MKRQWGLGWIALAALCLAFAATGCGCGDDDDDDDASPDDDAGDDDVDLDDDMSDDDDDSVVGCDEAPASTNEHTVLGLQYLSIPAGSMAREEFRLALEDDPDDQDALMGAMLADASSAFDAVSLIKTYVDLIAGEFETNEKADDDEENLQFYIDDLLDSALAWLFLEQAAEIDDLAAQALEVDCLSLELETLPIIVDFETIAEVGGDDWDESEVMATWGFVSGLGGAVRLLTVLNFDLDLTYLFGLEYIDFDSFSTIEVVSIIVDIVDRVLNDPAYPDFLTMNDGGYEDLLLAQEELGRGMRAAAGLFSAVRAETDGQSDDVLAYTDTNDNLLYDTFDHYAFQPWGEFDADEQALAGEFEALFASAGDSFLDNTDYDADPASPNPFDLAHLNALLGALGLPGILPHADIELNGLFESATPDGLRNTLRTIINLVQLVLPAPPEY